MSFTSPSGFRSHASRALRWFVVAISLALAFVAGAGPALAQSEPTLNDIYTAAKAGRIDEAQKLVTHVLVLHPQSAKAHYVQSELFARQNKLAEARTSLATAEKLAPGLPFARPEAVQALRDQLAASGKSAAAPPAAAATLGGVGPAPDTGKSTWMFQLGLAAVVIAAGYFIFRRKPPVAAPQAYPAGSGYAPGAPGAMPVQDNGLSGPQTFGSAASMGNASPYPPYPPGAPGYQQPYSPAYAPQQPQGPGLARQIAGGVATGLAVGAGVMAAQALARNLSERSEGGSHGAAEGAAVRAPLSNVNTDMGGQDFGIADGGSWDDGGSSDGGGGDWDS